MIRGGESAGAAETSNEARDERDDAGGIVLSGLGDSISDVRELSSVETCSAFTDLRVVAAAALGAAFRLAASSSAELSKPFFDAASDATAEFGGG